MTRRPTLVALDGGKSALRIVVAGPAGELSGTGPGFGYDTEQDDVAVIVEAAECALAGRSLPERVDRVCAGLTGVPGDRAERDRLRAGLGDLFGGCPVDVVEDSVLAHAGALGGPGVVVCAGTGTTVLALAGTGRHAGLDAWGPVLGDRGSGWSVAIAGLRAAAAALDGVGPATALAGSLTAVLGPVDLAAVQRLYRDRASTARIAEFAAEVAVAARGGDEVAIGIWREAGQALGATAVAAAERAGLTAAEARVSWAGRLFDAGDLLLAPLREHLRSAGLCLVDPAGDSLAGGLALAGRGPDSMYGQVLDHPHGSWR